MSGDDEEIGVDLPRRKERESARLLEICEELCTCETTSERSPESNNPEDVPGEVVKERFWDSGTGRVVCASKLSRRLGRMKSEPAAAERAWRDKAAETEERAVLKRAGSDG